MKDFYQCSPGNLISCSGFLSRASIRSRPWQPVSSLVGERRGNTEPGGRRHRGKFVFGIQTRTFWGRSACPQASRRKCPSLNTPQLPSSTWVLWIILSLMSPYRNSREKRGSRGGRGGRGGRGKSLFHIKRPFKVVRNNRVLFHRHYRPL